MSTAYQLWLFPLEKRCTRCGLTKTIGEFPTQRRSTNGHVRYDFKALCHICDRARGRSYWPASKRGQEAQARRAERAGRTEKRCPRCAAVKPLGAFSRDGRKAAGRAVWCKACHSQHGAALAAVRRHALPPPAQKRCAKCGLVQPGGAFSRGSYSRDGLHSWCKACVLAAKHARRLPKRVLLRRAEREALAEQGLRRCTKCGSIEPFKAFYRLKAKRHALSSWCKECCRAAVNGRAASDDYQYGRAYYAANRERLRRRMMERWHRNRADREAKTKKWKAEHPDWVRRQGKKAKAQRRARLARAGGTHSAKDIALLFERQRGCCAYCGVALIGRWSVDHIVPLARGGSNDVTNLCCACISCNSSKRDKLLSEWSGRSA